MQSDVLPYENNLGANTVGLLILLELLPKEKGQKLKKVTMSRETCQSSPDKWPKRRSAFPYPITPAVLPDGNGGFTPCPELIVRD